jgi:glycine cleavage system regulatory protein
MAHLAGQFAGILRVDVPAENQPALTEALQQLGKQGMTVVLHAEPTPTTPAAPGTLIQLHLLGHDRPGIVHQISSTLARHHVNVEELETGTESAPMTGEILFRTHAQLRLPPQIDLQALRTELERIAADLMVDLTLKPVTPTNP